MALTEEQQRLDELGVSLLESGNDVETMLTKVRADGATVADCIRVLESIGIEPKDAKRIVATSAAWSDLFDLARANKRS